LALKSLSQADWVRIQKAADFFAYQTMGNWPSEDLKHEALIRAFDGDRKCPRHINVAQFLVGVMRSIVSASAKAAGRKTRQMEMAGNEIALQLPDLDVGPEEQLIGRQSLERLKTDILKLFIQGSKEQLVVEGIMEGWEGSQLCELAEIDAHELATIRKFIRRKISRTSLNGTSNGG
jgi:DNA-directed RNA polymerase specialized sigma24 family protein